MITGIFYAGAGDCYFFPPSGDIWTGLNNVDFGKAGTATKNAWIPFANVTVPKNATVFSATFMVRASATGSSTTVKIKIGCEAADNPSDPTTIASAASRVLTTSYTINNNVAAWTAGVEYSFDITSAVQEVLKRSGWASGNKMAVLIMDNGSSDSASRSFSSYENPTYAEAILEIVYAIPGSVESVFLSDYGVM